MLPVVTQPVTTGYSYQVSCVTNSVTRDIVVGNPSEHFCKAMFTVLEPFIELKKLLLQHLVEDGMNEHGIFLESFILLKLLSSAINKSTINLCIFILRASSFSYEGLMIS